MVTILKFMVSRRFTCLVQGSAEIMQQRSYEDAVKKLTSLKTQVSGQIRRSGGRLAQNNLPKMRRFTERAGVKMEDLDKLSIIHISGTKGKGSTCAFCESILRHKGFKTGFYSSPHLIEVRERIRINGKPLPRDKFAKYFFDCWDNLCNNGDGTMPASRFRFLTLMSFHVFLQEKVDVVILEVGIGGAYDSTNIVRKPVVCGVTSLGMDHVSTLGGTLEKIAWQKAGIFKPGIPAFTVPQPENAMAVVADRAQEIKAPLHVVPSLEQYPGKLPDLGLEGEHQHLNASLALQLCTTWLHNSQSDKDSFAKAVYVHEESSTQSSMGKHSSDEPSTKKAKLDVPVAEPFEVPDSLRSGLKNTRWCGRNQVVVRPQVTFYLDGAHTPKSMEACAKWFKKRADEEKRKESGSVARVLLFNLTGDRDPHNLLRPVMKCNFDHAIFSPNNANPDPKSSDADLSNFTVTRDSQLRWCVENQRVWMALRGAGFQAYEDQSSGCTDTEHVIQNGHDDGPYSTIFPCVSQAIRWLLAGREPVIPPLSPGGFPLPDFISQATKIQVLISGSLHLVGTAMKVLGPEIVRDQYDDV